MAKVRDGRITVHDVELPDGTEVSVSVVEQPAFELTEQDLVDIRKAEAEYERGEHIPGEQVIRELEERALHRRLEREREAAAEPGDRLVGPKPNSRVRAARRRRA